MFHVYVVCASPLRDAQSGAAYGKRLFMTEPTNAPLPLSSESSAGDKASTTRQNSNSSPGAQGRKKVLTLCLATVIALGLAEVGVRLVWHNPFRYEAPDHLLKIRMHHPHTDYIFNRSVVTPEHPWVRLRTDARSYILPSFQYQDPDATIAFLGGSTTECSAVQEDLRFPALVSRLLAQRGLQVNTLNAARSGSTLHDVLNVLLNHVSADRPDIAVVMEASNDIGVLKEDESYQSRMGAPVAIVDFAKWSLQIASSKLYLAALVRANANVGQFLTSDPTQDWRHHQPTLQQSFVHVYRQRLKAFVHLCRSFDIQPVLMTQPFSGSTNALTPYWVDRTAQDQFNAVIRTVGEEEGVPVIDLVSYLQEQVPDWNKPMEIFYDAIHVTDKGSQVYAQYITERLLPLILQKKTSTSLEKLDNHRAHIADK
jgi:GDSL-like Lipase/Acylhydrolase family